MKKTVHVIDYGIGNIFNLINAFEYLNIQVIHCRHVKDLQNADKIIIPGVGAFADCINAFKKYHFDEYVNQHIEKQKPLLGICVGMQLLADSSEEHGQHKGLGVIGGRVVNIDNFRYSNSVKLRIPNVGWRKIYPRDSNKNWNNTPFKSIDPGEFLYFVHSYAFESENQENLLAECKYESISIPAAVYSNNIYGVQFHPEKSGKAGLTFLKNFSEIN